jgi:hypothetical protein
MDDREGTSRTFVERLEVTGGELVDRFRDLVADGNARRVIIRDSDGEELLTAPLTFGVVAGGIITVAAPLLAALGALAALVTRVKLEVVREVVDPPAVAGAPAEMAAPTSVSERSPSSAPDVG